VLAAIIAGSAIAVITYKARSGHFHPWRKKIISSARME
jgi:hypothetical protein